MSSVTLTINGQQVTVPKGTSVLYAARKVGIDIPTFCHDTKNWSLHSRFLLCNIIQHNATKHDIIIT